MEVTGGEQDPAPTLTVISRFNGSAGAIIFSGSDGIRCGESEVLSRGPIEYECSACSQAGKGGAGAPWTSDTSHESNTVRLRVR